jgi:hypothetical protein
MMPSSLGIWDAILKIEFSTSEFTKIRHFKTEGIKKCLGRGHSSYVISPSLGALNTLILTPSALITVSWFFGQNSWQPYILIYCFTPQMKMLNSPVCCCRLEIEVKPRLFYS